MEELQAKPPWELNRRELDRKAAELDRALLLSQALSARHVELMAEHATVVAELEEQGLRVEEDHLALIDIVAELLEQQQLSVEIAVLKDELHELSTDKNIITLQQGEYIHASNKLDEVRLQVRKLADSSSLDGRTQGLAFSL